MNITVSGMSGNELYCLAQKDLWPGEIAVGNSVFSLGLGGAISAFGQAIAGGELSNLSQLISQGRHAAIDRMEDDARRLGAAGVTGVVSELRLLGGYHEFLSQGTSVHAKIAPARLFSTSASGADLYCHLDAGYQPIRFAMGNIAYALGIGAGLTGMLRSLARGEVHEFSQMYNQIRHTALARLQREAAELGANAVVDVKLRMLPMSGAVELLITGTASHHPRFSTGPVSPEQVVTSELTGDELWNLAQMGYAPVRLVMATSVYSLGLTRSIGAVFQSMSRGELPEVTRLVYQARENCLELIRKEAQHYGAERVIGNKLMIYDLGGGVIDVIGVGTAVRRLDGIKPATPTLIPQAIIVDRESINLEGSLQIGGASSRAGLRSKLGCLVAASIGMMITFGIFAAIMSGIMAHR
jgi:uncharacterized protein YbjQ (UPF0145 family)